MNEIDLQLNSAQWISNKIDEELIKYRKAKTETDKSRLIPIIKFLASKLQFEKTELVKNFGDIEELRNFIKEFENGETWKLCD